MLSDREFNDLVDVALQHIEDSVEDADGDIDIETSGGILTLTMENRSKVIVNRQGATQEIWVAARSGGYHCGRKGDQWHCNVTGETLHELLARVIAEQGGGAVDFG